MHSLLSQQPQWLAPQFEIFRLDSGVTAVITGDATQVKPHILLQRKIPRFVSDPVSLLPWWHLWQVAAGILEGRLEGVPDILRCGWTMGVSRDMALKGMRQCTTKGYESVPL